MKTESTRQWGAKPTLRSPLNLAKQIINELHSSREIAWRLFIRNTSASFRHSFLGWFWAFMPAVFTSLIWIFLQKSEVISISPTEIPYPIYVLTGTILWKCFTESVQMPISSMLGSANMLSKVYVPTEAIISSGFLSLIFSTTIRSIILIIVILSFGVSLTPSLLLFPILIMVLLILGTTFGLTLTPVAMLYRDVSRILNYALQFLFYLTPIVYPLPKDPQLAQLAYYNPVTPVLNMTRDVLTGKVLVHSQYVIAIGIISSLALAITIICLKATMPHIIERVNS